MLSLLSINQSIYSPHFWFIQQYFKDTYAHTLHRTVPDKSSTWYRCSSLNLPGLRLLGRGEDGDSAADLFRDDCCPGIASSASSIIKFCTENTENVLKQDYTWPVSSVQVMCHKMHTHKATTVSMYLDLCYCYSCQLTANITAITSLPSLQTFKHALKTKLFHRSYDNAN